MMNFGSDMGLEFDSVAEALHSAVRRLKEDTTREEGSSLEYPHEPFMWAPFIHLGA
jgi:hypothetical protein